MKNFNPKTMFLLLLVMLIIGCSDSYFDVNTPANTAIEEELGMRDLIAPVIHSTMEGQRSAELAFGNYTQYFVGTGGSAAGQTSASGLWTQIYLYVLPNLKVVKEKAIENEATHIGAISDILVAINLGIATDTWDDIPYSEATQGPDSNFPAFDTQESIYEEIFSLLDGAISALSASDDSGFSLGSADLIYGGDSDKWLRAAYTIKARHQLRLLGKGVSPSDVLSTIDDGFTSNDDNFQMFYSDKNINPWYSAEVLSRSTGNLSNDIASQIVSSMNGDYYPFAGTIEIDPRLPEIAEIPSGDTEYRGFVSGGDGLSPSGSEDANTGFKTDGYYTSIASPLTLISYAEALFIKAEAAFLANGGTTTSVGTTSMAYQAYLDGIAASMDMWGVDGSEYLADASIAVGEGNLMLHHIMKEKYIHNFLNPETFTDFRRYDFSDDVFTGLTIRLEDATDESDFVGEWFLRAIYPATELTRNEANVLANQETPITPVWWDM